MLFAGDGASKDGNMKKWRSAAVQSVPERHFYQFRIAGYRRNTLSQHGRTMRRIPDRFFDIPDA